MKCDQYGDSRTERQTAGGRQQDRDHVVALPSVPDSRISFANTAKALLYATRVTHRMFLLCTERSIHKNVTHISLNCLLILAEN